MDGNGRWAAERGIARSSGHKAGAEQLIKIAKIASEIGIQHVTFFAFSAENWQRPHVEVSYLLDLLSYYVTEEIKNLSNQNIRLKIIGDLTKLDNKLRIKVERAIEQTQNNNGTCVYIAFSYGGQQEIVHACQNIVASGLDATLLTIENFAHYLYAPEMLPVDLLIRPGGEQRISNFLLWQIAYAELYFTDTKWPAFDREELLQIIAEYEKRKRRFGKRSEVNDE